MKKDHDYIVDMAKYYPEKPPKEEGDNEDDESEVQSRFIGDFRKINKRYIRLKCQCPEGKILSEEYNTNRAEFDKLREDFSQKKMKNELNFGLLDDFND